MSVILHIHVTPCPAPHKSVPKMHSLVPMEMRPSSMEMRPSFSQGQVELCADTVPPVTQLLRKCKVLCEQARVCMNGWVCVWCAYAYDNMYVCFTSCPAPHRSAPKTHNLVPMEMRPSFSRCVRGRSS